MPDLPKGKPVGVSIRRQQREAEQQIEKTSDRASYPRPRSDATELDRPIKDGELEMEEDRATSSKQLLLNRPQLMALNLKRYLKMRCL